MSDPGVLHRRDPSSGEVIAELPDITEVVAGERVIVAQSFDRNLVTVDPNTLTADAERFPSVGSYVDSMDLSDDEQRLLVAGADRQVRLYDAASRSQLGTDITTDVAADAFPFVGPLWTRGAAIRDDGREAAIITDDGIVVWDLDPERWSEAACELASRNLTQEEWDAYIGDLASYRETCPNLP